MSGATRAARRLHRGAGPCAVAGERGDEGRRAGRRGPCALAAVVALTAASLFGCGEQGEGERFPGAPIVLISIDTLRSDRLPAYGYRGVETPAIDALARDGMVFERAYSHYPLTLPSHVSLFTGLLPDTHGVRDNLGYAVPAESSPYLPRLLRDAGYATGGAVSAFVLRAETGIAEGFDWYDAALVPEKGESLDAVQRSGEQTLAATVEWLRGVATRPCFLFFHVYEPHAPYVPAARFAERYREQPYDGEVATADAVVGELVAELRRLGIYDRAVVALLSDHGEGLGEHGERQHGVFLYRESLQVPLLLKLPASRRAGERVPTPVQLVDVLPTLLSLAGVEPPADLPGRSLLALADEPGPPRPIYAETFYPRIHFGWSELTSLIEDRHHLVDGPQPELFDLLADPAEVRDVLPEQRRVFAGLRAELARHDRELQAPTAVDAETARKLAALGYLATPAAAGGGPLPDPRSRREQLGELEAAYMAMNLGRHQEAVERFTRLLASSPQMQDAWAYYGKALRELGRIDEAAAAYEKALALSAGTPQVALSFAIQMLEMGRYADAERLASAAEGALPEEVRELRVESRLAQGDLAGALAMMRQAVTAGEASEGLRVKLGLTLSEAGQAEEAIAVLGPLAAAGEPPVLNALGIALSDAGRHREAIATLERAVAADAENALALQNLGIVSLRLEQPLVAEARLQQALALRPELPIAWNTLGVVRYRLGKTEEAIAAWRQAVTLDPAQHDAWFNLGLVAAASGRRELAQEALRAFIAGAPPQRFATDIARARSLLREVGG